MYRAVQTIMNKRLQSLTWDWNITGLQPCMRLGFMVRMLIKDQQNVNICTLHLLVFHTPSNRQVNTVTFTVVSYLGKIKILKLQTRADWKLRKRCFLSFQLLFTDFVMTIYILSITEVPDYGNGINFSIHLDFNTNAWRSVKRNTVSFIPPAFLCLDPLLCQAHLNSYNHSPGTGAW